jgi:excisionase family DNA binding protein
MKLTLGQAARQAGISKSYLSRLVKSGKISAERQENGEFRIDPSELDRLADIRPHGHDAGNSTSERLETPRELVLQREVELLREMLHDKEQTLQDVRRERDAWRQQAQTLLLTAGETKSRRWWRWGKAGTKE